MRRISDIIAAGPTLSVEFFPPRSEEAERQLTDALADLAGLGPSFASVTYGALGSTRDRTRDLVIGMNADHPFPTMAHLTCVGHTRAEIARLLDDYAAAGVTNILALGGDPPADGRPPDGDFTYAIELVEVVRAHPAGFSVGVAAHPELHPRSADRAEDRRHLAEKLALADFAITQFFFRAEDYARMLDELAALGCHRPVIAGVMPIISAAGVRRMADMNRHADPAGAVGAARPRGRRPGRGRGARRGDRRGPQRGARGVRRPRAAPLQPQPLRVGAAAVDAGDVRSARVNRPSSVLKSGAGRYGSVPVGDWDFLTNHAHVLLCLRRDPTARMRDVAAAVGITERAAQRIVAELEEDGYLSRERDGRRNRYVLHEGRSLRHPLEGSHTVDELLNLLATGR